MSPVREQISTCVCCGAATITYTRALKDGEQGLLAACGDCGHLTIISPGPLDYGGEEYEASYHGSRAPAKIFADAIPLARKRAAGMKSHLQGARTLDIGCAAGSFLSAAMEAGAACAEGMEMNDELRAFVARSHTAYKKFDQIPTSARFDIITLFRVLEHIDDPLPFLRSVSELLAPGGLVVIDVPSSEMLALRHSTGDRRWFYHRAHRQYFTRRSIDQLMARAGIRGEVFTSQDTGLVYCMDRMLDDGRYYRYVRLPLVAPLFIMAKLGGERVFSRWAASRGAGDALIFRGTQCK
ncbi:MAG TPA: class I SAM-dependent methyltransferase [Methanocella sp.]|nr:class I SAM-dependent methyltransferase [Methanocella sp.]